jgi:hypothetical protein
VNVTGTDANAVGGTVSFAFQSFLTNGQLDLSSVFATATVSGTATSGTASVTTSIPPGLVQPNQAVQIVAEYGGDAHHLPSVSSVVPISFTSVPFCIVPGAATTAPGVVFDFTAPGGFPPVRWYVLADTTCDANFNNCSQLDMGSGKFTAGTGQPGYVLIQAIDADQADTFGEITVGAPTGAPPWAGNSGVLASTCPTPLPVDGGVGDSGVTDSGTAEDSGSAPIDAGSPVDSGGPAGNPTDAGGSQGTGGIPDGSLSPGSGTDAASGTADTSGSAAGNGCSCRAAKPGEVSPPALAGFGALVALSGLRLRRRRAR